MHYENAKFGYIVTDCDYENDPQRVLKLLGDGRVVVIRNEKPVDPEVLIEFYKKMGRVVKQNEKVKGNVDGHGELIRVRQNGLFAGKDDGELEWHSAGMNRTDHDDIVIMYMHQPAESGGDTYFTDHQTAFEDLDEETKEICRNVKSKTVTYTARMKLEKMHYKNVFSDEQTMMEFRDIDGKTSFAKQTPRKELVTRHPINGKEGLYFPWSVIRGFSGINFDRKQQHDLYYKLKEHTLSDKYVYRHKWNAYDICLSEQHHSLHKRDAYTGDRELWRAGVWLH